MKSRPRSTGRNSEGFVIGFVLTSLLLPAIETKGQEALRSAILLDQAIARETNAPVNVQPDRPHIGPVQLVLGAYASSTYDDNINTSQANPKSDVLLRSGITTGFDYPITDNSELQFGTGLGYLHYVQNTREDGLEITPDSALAYSALFGDVQFTLFDQFYYSREVISQGAVANLTSLPRLENTAGFRIGWNPNQWLLECGYSHDVYTSESASLNYLDRTSEFFFGRVGWRCAEATQAGIELSGSLTRYDLPTQDDNHSTSIGVFGQWQVRPWLQVILRSGPTFYTFEPRGTNSSSTLNSYYVSLDATHQLTDFFSHMLALQRSVQLGPNRGANYVEQFTAKYSFSWDLTQHIRVGAWIGYEHGNQPLPIFLGDFVFNSMEKFDRYGGGAQITWRMTEKLSANFGFGHWLRESNFRDRRYSDNSVSLGLSYTL